MATTDHNSLAPNFSRFPSSAQPAVIASQYRDITTLLSYTMQQQYASAMRQQRATGGAGQHRAFVRTSAIYSSNACSTARAVKCQAAINTAEEKEVWPGVLEG